MRTTADPSIESIVRRIIPLVVVLTTSTAPAVLGAEGGGRPVGAVSEVDLDRYAGRWHEIARLPNMFQGDCACCVTATYRRRDDGRLTVVNECRRADGSVNAVEGEAKLAKDDGPTSRLKVRFAPAFLSFLGFVWGDYWVLDLATHRHLHTPGRGPDRHGRVLGARPGWQRHGHGGGAPPGGGLAGGGDVLTSRPVRVPASAGFRPADLGGGYS